MLGYLEHWGGKGRPGCVRGALWVRRVGAGTWRTHSLGFAHGCAWNPCQVIRTSRPAERIAWALIYSNPSLSICRYPYNITENAKLAFFHLAGQCRSLLIQCFNTHVDERDSPRSTFPSPDNSRR